MPLDENLEAAVGEQALLEPVTSGASPRVQIRDSVPPTLTPSALQVHRQLHSAVHRQQGLVAVCLEISRQLAFSGHNQPQQRLEVCLGHRILPHPPLGHPRARDSEPTTPQVCSVTTRTNQQAVCLEIPAPTPPPDLVSATLPPQLQTRILLAALVAAVCLEPITTLRLRDRAFLVKTRIKISRSRRCLVALSEQIPHNPNRRVGSLAMPVLQTLAPGCLETTLAHSLRAVSSAVAARIRHRVCSEGTTTRHKNHFSVAATPIPAGEFLAIHRTSLRLLGSSGTTQISSKVNLSKVLLCLGATTIRLVLVFLEA